MLPNSGLQRLGDPKWQFFSSDSKFPDTARQWSTGSFYWNLATLDHDVQHPMLTTVLVLRSVNLVWFSLRREVLSEQCIYGVTDLLIVYAVRGGDNDFLRVAVISTETSKTSEAVGYQWCILPGWLIGIKSCERQDLRCLAALTLSLGRAEPKTRNYAETLQRRSRRSFDLPGVMQMQIALLCDPAAEMECRTRARLDGFLARWGGPSMWVIVKWDEHVAGAYYHSMLWDAAR